MSRFEIRNCNIDRPNQITFYEHPKVISQLEIIQQRQENDTGWHVRLHGHLE